ncbi:MAG: hypothetical protein HQL38_18140, partial [Alphaproteobacteria bacterium]|nr:hypothetical protein [Alphaproteobacteria bacterium]
MLLSYWRASLADGLLPGLPKGTRRDLAPADLAVGAVDQRTAARLFEDWARQQDKRQDRPAAIPVLIGPLVFIPRHANGVAARRVKDAPFCPVILPASLSKSGALEFDPTRLPWVDRRALEPTAAAEPPLGRLDDFDAFRSSTRAPEGEWEAYLGYVDTMCRALAGAGLAELAIPGYDRAPPLIMAGEPPFSPTKHLLDLADHLLGHGDAPTGALAGLLRQPATRPLLGGDWPPHLGQMNGVHAL